MRRIRRKYLKDIPVRRFAVSSFNVESLNDASDLKVTDELSIDHSEIVSLDGIEHFEGISSIDLRQCTNLTDLSPVNKLKSLEYLDISPEMEDLAGAVDERIRVEIYD